MTEQEARDYYTKSKNVPDNHCTPIRWTDALPGDLVFYPDDSDVGIVGGYDLDGNLRIIHCASGWNNVIITGIEDFTSIGRPDYYE